jgi:hypothetical protein
VFRARNGTYIRSYQTSGSTRLSRRTSIRRIRTWWYTSPGMSRSSIAWSSRARSFASRLFGSHSRPIAVSAKVRSPVDSIRRACRANP